MLHLWKEESLSQQFNPSNFPGEIPPVNDKDNGEIPWILLLHIGRNVDLWHFYRDHFMATLSRKYPPHFILTVHENIDIGDIEHDVGKMHLDNVIEAFHIVRIPNQGMDLFSLWFVVSTVEKHWSTVHFHAILKLHTKGTSEEWRDTMMNDALPTPEWVEYILRVFQQHHDFGAVYGYSEPYDGMNEAFVLDYFARCNIFPKKRTELASSLVQSVQLLQNAYRNKEQSDSFVGDCVYDFLIDTYLNPHITSFMNPMIYRTIIMQSYPFFTLHRDYIRCISGSTFWLRWEVLKDIVTRLPLEIMQEELEVGLVKDDIWMTRTHALERFIPLYPLIQGFKTLNFKLKPYIYSLQIQHITNTFQSAPWISPQKINQLAPIFPAFSKPVYGGGLMPSSSWVIPIGFQHGLPVPWFRKDVWEMTRIRNLKNVSWKMYAPRNVHDLQYHAVSIAKESVFRKTPTIFWLPLQYAGLATHMWIQLGLPWKQPLVWVEFYPYPTHDYGILTWISEWFARITPWLPKSTTIEHIWGNPNADDTDDIIITEPSFIMNKSIGTFKNNTLRSGMTRSCSFEDFTKAWNLISVPSNFGITALFQYLYISADIHIPLTLPPKFIQNTHPLAQTPGIIYTFRIYSQKCIETFNQILPYIQIPHNLQNIFILIEPHQPPFGTNSEYIPTLEQFFKQINTQFHKQHIFIIPSKSSVEFLPLYYQNQPIQDYWTQIIQPYAQKITWITQFKNFHVSPTDNWKSSMEITPIIQAPHPAVQVILDILFTKWIQEPFAQYEYILFETNNLNCVSKSVHYRKSIEMGLLEKLRKQPTIKLPTDEQWNLSIQSTLFQSCAVWSIMNKSDVLKNTPTSQIINSGIHWNEIPDTEKSYYNWLGIPRYEIRP